MDVLKGHTYNLEKDAHLSLGSDFTTNYPRALEKAYEFSKNL